MKTNYKKYSVVFILILMFGLVGVGCESNKSSTKEDKKVEKENVEKIANNKLNANDKKDKKLKKEEKQKVDTGEDNKVDDNKNKSETKPVEENENAKQEQQSAQSQPTPEPAPQPEPTPQPQPTPPPTSGTYSEALALVNQIRNENGLPPLTMGNVQLQNAANIRANEITTNFSHTRNGQPWDSIFDELGIQVASAGENIYFDSAGGNYVEAVIAWINSPGHLENMLNPDVTQVVIGKSGGYYAMLLI